MKEMAKPSKLPKIRVKWLYLGSPEEETTCDFEEAKHLIFGNRINRVWSRALAEDERISSYEELVHLAAQDQHKNKEVLNITLFIPVVAGG